MLKLILGRGGWGKTSQTLHRLCQAGQERPQVLIVPEQQSHEMERALCSAGGDSASLWAEVLSFSRLANRVFQAAGGLGVTELDAGGRLLLMHRAVRNVSVQLTVYRQPSRKVSFLRSLLATVEELKRCCVSAETLIRAGEELGGQEGQKLRDLGLICAEYIRLTGESGLDPLDRLTRAGEKLKVFPWAKGKDLWLDGFTDFTPQQMELLRLLMVQAEHITVTLTCDTLDGAADEEDVFAVSRRTGRMLRQLARENHIPCEVELLADQNGKRVSALTHLEGQLFSLENCPPVAANGAVELFRGDSLRSEVEWTAARIRTLVKERGLRYRDIGVCARNYGDYRHLVESIFPRYEVPVFSSGMTDILERPVLTLVTAALDMVSNGYSYDSLFRYLKTGLTDLAENDRDELENYALKWDIRGSQWSQSKAWTWHPRGYGYPLEEGDRQRLERLDALRRTVVEPLEKLRKNPEKTGRGQAIALYTFMEDIGLPTRLEDRVTRFREAGNPALADEYRQLWEILCSGLEQCARLLGEAEMELEEFSNLFRLVLSQYDVGSIPVSLDRVTAGETTRLSSRGVKVLFLLGADDATIPQIGAAAGLLTDDDRVLLQGYGAQLYQTRYELLGREMTTIYQLCVQPTEKLIVTWPAVGPGGEERRPCFLAQRLLRLFDDVTITTQEETGGDFRLSAPIPALEQAGRSERARRLLEGLPEYKSERSKLLRASAMERGSLSRPAVDALYGRRIPMSASRMDKYKSCHFSYFMQYGLKAQPRKAAGFAAPEYGTFVHYVLEHVLQHELCRNLPPCGEEETNLPPDWKKALRRLTKETVDRYVREELGGLEGQSDRFRYLFGRLLRSVYAVVENVVQELRCSKFRPISFELGFGRGPDADLPPVELTVDDVTISVSGFVDRLDGWVKDGRLNLRVVDYKTGRKSFDMTEVWNGLGLQMLLYLFTLQDRGRELYKMPVDSVGVLYLPARDAVIRGSRTMEDETLRHEMDKELVRSGLVLDDPEVLGAMETVGKGGYRFLPLRVSKTTGKISGDALVSAEQMGRLGRHIQTVLEEICRELARGDITADPYWRGPEKNACRYCDYAAACQFEEGRSGDCRRWLPTMSTARFWEALDRGDETRNEVPHGISPDC